MSYFNLELLCEEPDTEVTLPAFVECVNYGICDELVPVEHLEERRCSQCHQPLGNRCWKTADDMNFCPAHLAEYEAERADNVRLWGADWRKRLMAGAA